MMRYTPRLSAITTAAALLFAAAPSHALNLMEAVEAALNNDAAWQAAQFDAQAIQRNRPIAAASFYPQVSLSMSQGRSEFDREFPVLGRPTRDIQSQNTKNNVLQLRQTLFSLDAVARFRQAGVQAEAARETLRKERQDLILRVATSYIEVLTNYDIHQLSQADDKAASEQASVLESAYKRGEAAMTDAAEARARADIARVKLVEAAEQLDGSLRALELTTGLRIEDLSGLNKAFDWRDAVKQPFEDWRDAAAAANPEMRQTQQTIEFFKEEILRQRAGHAPRLDLVVSQTQAQSDTVNTIGIKSDIKATALQLQLPIFAGFAVNEGVAQAQLRMQKAEADRDATFRRINTDLFKNYTATRRANDKLTALDRAVKSAEESLRAAQLGKKTGLRVMVDVLTAQQKLYQARVDYARGFYESVLALLRLRAGAGALADVDLAAVTAVFGGESVNVRSASLSNASGSAGRD